MRLVVTGEVIEWRGPAPHHFVRLADDDGADLAAMPELSYGWGCIKVTGMLGATTFTTSLIPKDGGYLLPLKAAVRRAEGVEVGDLVTAEIEIVDPADSTP